MHHKDFRIIDGWSQAATIKPSPNYDERPAQQDVDLLVIHAISLPPGQFGGGFIEDFFQNKLDPNAHPYFAEIAALKVSSHFLINRGGELIQFVATDKRAWHCGESNFCGRERCNDFSIGVELEGCDEQAFDDAQYRCLNELTQAIRAAYPSIGAANITGHADIAPERKTDPGPLFNWDRYLAGLD